MYIYIYIYICVYIYITICENMQKYAKIQASVQHGLYLFTCEIHSFNSIPGYLTECLGVFFCILNTV